MTVTVGKLWAICGHAARINAGTDRSAAHGIASAHGLTIRLNPWVPALAAIRVVDALGGRGHAGPQAWFVGSLADSLWHRNRVLAEAALDHTFVQGIASGELARATFPYYVGQDAAFLWGDNGEPQHLVVGAAVCGPFLCPLVRCFLLLWCHHNGVRAGNHRRHMAGGEPPHHVRRRAVGGVHLRNKPPLFRALGCRALDHQPVAYVGFHRRLLPPLLFRFCAPPRVGGTPGPRASRLITPRAPPTQVRCNGEPLPGALQPGDLAVWDGHVAMIVGNGTMIEARCQLGVEPPLSWHRLGPASHCARSWARSGWPLGALWIVGRSLHRLCTTMRHLARSSGSHTNSDTPVGMPFSLV